MIPFTRKIILSRIIKKRTRKNYQEKNYIDGDYEEIGEDDDKKI